MTKELNTEALLTIGDAARILKVCVRTIRRMIDRTDDRLPVIRIGGAIRISPTDLQRYIAAHRHD